MSLNRTNMPSNRASWFSKKRQRLLRVSAAFLTFLASLIAGASIASAANIFTYDQLGRLATARYDNGICIAYTYDANGNRTAITTAATTPQSPTWGSTNWGCFNWSPQ